VIDIKREIQDLEQGKTYKYLGTEEGEGTQQIQKYLAYFTQTT
jgi:hypothetical protein